AQSRAQREKVLSDLFEAEEWRSAAVSESVRRYTVRESVSIRALQRILSPSELVLQYVLSDPDSYCIAINRSSAHVVRLGSSRGRIELLAHEYLDKVRAKQSSEQDARRLYSILLAPITSLRGATRIVVVPDGVLHLLPFDALQSGDGKYVLDSAV